MSKQNHQIVPYQQRVNNIRTMLEKHKSQIALALPRHMDADRMARIALTSVQQQPGLLECTPQSLFGAVVQAAQLGLEPDGVLGHAYLIPFRNNKKNCREVQFMPGYKGLCDLARRSGFITLIYARCVHANDEFDYEFGLNPNIVHRECRERERGELIAVYAVAHFKDGGKQFDVMLAHEVEKIRAETKKRNGGNESPAWLHHTEEMYKKTVLRRLCKMLPASVELQKAVALDERVEAGISQDLEHVIDIGADEISEPSQSTNGANGNADNGATNQKAAMEDGMREAARKAIDAAANGADVDTLVEMIGSDPAYDDIREEVLAWCESKRAEISKGQKKGARK